MSLAHSSLSDTDVHLLGLSQKRGKCQYGSPESLEAAGGHSRPSDVPSLSVRELTLMASPGGSTC
jgi:hypothetical protein